VTSIKEISVKISVEDAEFGRISDLWEVKAKQRDAKGERGKESERYQKGQTAKISVRLLQEKKFQKEKVINIKKTVNGAN
jgi:hypothetical protein